MNSDDINKHIAEAMGPTGLEQYVGRLTGGIDWGRALEIDTFGLAEDFEAYRAEPEAGIPIAIHMRYRGRTYSAIIVGEEDGFWVSLSQYPGVPPGSSDPAADWGYNRFCNIEAAFVAAMLAVVTIGQ